MRRRRFQFPFSSDFFEHRLVENEEVIEDQAGHDNGKTKSISLDERCDGVDDDRDQENEMEKSENRIAEPRSFFGRGRFLCHGEKEKASAYLLSIRRIEMIVTGCRGASS